MKRPLRVFAMIVVVILSFCAGCWAAGFNAVDNCLDAGGVWSERNFCEGARPYG